MHVYARREGRARDQAADRNNADYFYPLVLEFKFTFISQHLQVSMI